MVVSEWSGGNGQVIGGFHQQLWQPKEKKEKGCPDGGRECKH